MLRIQRILFAFTILLSAAFPATSQELSESTVKDAVERFGRAFVKADVKALSELLAKDYVHVNGNSGKVLSKNDWLKWIATRPPLLKSRQLVIEKYEISDLEVRLFGGSAIVTGLVRSIGKRNGADFETSIRFTNVWVIEDGALKRAAFHDSAVPPPKN